MNRILLFLTSVGVLGLLALLPAQAQTYQQVWADEFNGGISADWQFETGGGGWGNNEKQYYQAANATVVNGELRITARKENVGGFPYTSARMKTQGRKEFTYGKVEARIKMPLGQGLWPAFWMLGANINSVSWPRCGEIDVMEHINAESKVYGTVHWDSNGHAEYGGNTITTPQEFHVYSIEWTPTFIKWFVDGVQFHEINIANGTGGTEEFQRPFFLLLNLAVAGNWPGQTVDETKLPATMAVDYVRVYQLGSSSFSRQIEAEAFSSMQGVQVEACSEGGQNVGYIDATDWLAYANVNFPSSGQYTIEYRVASLSGSRLSADLNAGAVRLGEVNIPATGGWQNWTTVRQTVNVSAGTYSFGVYALAGGWNLNWIRISKAGANRAAASATKPQATLSAADAVDVYPNPVGSQLLLRSTQRLTGSQYEVLDAHGQVQASGTLGATGIDVAQLRGGVYTLRLITPDNQKITRRLLKQ